MGIKYEVTAVTGSYTDRDGNEKKRYHKLGVVMETKNGEMLKLESIPLGWDGWAYLNEPKEREQGQAQQKPQRRQAQVPAGDFDESDAIPF